MKKFIFIFSFISSFLFTNTNDLFFLNEFSIYYINETVIYNNNKNNLNGLNIRYSVPGIVRAFSFSFSQNYGENYSKTSYSVGISPFFPFALFDGALGGFLIKNLRPEAGCVGCCLGPSIVVLALYSEIYFQPTFCSINLKDRNEWIFYPEFTFNITIPLWYFFTEIRNLFPLYLKAGWSTILFKEILSSRFENSSFNIGFSICF